ncbi:MAG: glycosyl transferase family 2 [Clostridia bacterium]|nr:glycosyl transferase family 2 [Clostridia bacterium]
MDKFLKDVIEGKADNCLLPFYWQHGNHTEKIPEQMELIYRSGTRAVCVESRPHPDFCGDGWWRDMDIILAMAEKLGMQVWILDDDHFPTGHANSAIKNKYPELAPRTLVESHTDFVGPAKEATGLVRRMDLADELLAVCAWRRSGEGEGLVGEPIILTDCVNDDILCWDVPEGYWRVFNIFASRRFSNQEYIDMLRPESVKVLLDEVYEPHFAHYGRYFGNVIAGFFSDEPCFQNFHFSGEGSFYSFKANVGVPGIALPWTDEVCRRLEEKLGRSILEISPLLWFDGENASELRTAYMDVVTDMYGEYFSVQLGKWCEQHGVRYIGHIVEDMNSHTKLSCSAGHFFRSQRGQHMSGIDIVLNQVMPGFAGVDTAAACSPGLVDAEFFHNVLGQLAASSAINDPLKRGEAMCEVFGAYGWAEGTPVMKWLMDFLIVRGVNRFVPHAFSPDFPNPDCPPHFGVEGKDPQFEGFTELMEYTKNTVHLFKDSRRIAPVAVLYQAEAEWANGSDAMLTQKPAAEFYRNHVAFDILCADDLFSASVINGRLTLGGEYSCLVVPAAPILPKDIVERINDLAAEGLRVIYVDLATKGAVGGEVIRLKELGSELSSLATVKVENELPLLRIMHCRRDESEQIMLVNEDAVNTARGEIALPFVGEYTLILPQFKKYFACRTDDGRVSIELPPFTSAVVISGPACGEALPELCELGEIDTTWNISLAQYDSMESFLPYRGTSELFNVSRVLPRFSGKIRYEAESSLTKLRR